MTTPRPHLLLTAEPTPGLRTVADLRAAIGEGLAARLWSIVRAIADDARAGAPLMPATPLPHRGADHVAKRNREYTLCHAVSVRLLASALCWLVTEERRYLDCAMAQLRCLFDRRHWPQWRDLSHPPPADLRTGQLAAPVGLAYDWLHAGLTAAQRAEIIAGLDDQAVQPYLQSIPGAWWYNTRNNWLTVITGGLGIAGMGMGDDHPAAASLVADAVAKMRWYLGVYGPQGEFNEAPMYANANCVPVDFFMAYRYHTRGGENPLAAHPFPAACRWVMHATEPSGLAVAFGDTPLDTHVTVDYFAAVAAASRDSTLQGFFMRYLREDAFLRQGNPVMQLLHYEPTLPAAAPGQWDEPLARAYAAHGRILVSRTDWEDGPGICVAAKAGQTEAHGHHDAGQLIVTAMGERLITDPGSIDYPADYFDPARRYCYYNASVAGHNVLCIAGCETLHRDGVVLDFASRAGEFAAWTIDLTPCYEGALCVRRSVRHHLPGVVAVLDEVRLPGPESMTLRWHTAAAATPEADGTFVVQSGGARCVGRVVRLDEGDVELSTGRHEYREPYDRSRLGSPLRQKHEPYVQVGVRAASCRLLTLLAVQGAGKPLSRWEACGPHWQIRTRDGFVRVSQAAGALTSRFQTQT